MADSITYRIGALLEAKGNLGARVNQQAKAVDALGARLTGATNKVASFGSSMLNSASSAALGYGKLATQIAAVSAAAGAAAFTKIGFTGNVGLEKMQNTIAGTLQLFGHSANHADRLGNNIKVAGAALMEIQNIADAAPGELQDIQMLFQNMLPGARAATGEMRRILDLSKNVALFTPTFGVDFKTAGSQVSRMLSGGAGAEMETWRTLQPLILQAGLAMDKMGQKGKIFAKSLQGADPEKITQAFNKLQKEDRLALFEKALSTGGDELAAMYAKSWEGATASAISSSRKVAMGFGKPLFESTKKALVKAGEEGGVFSKARVMPMAAKAEAMGKLLAIPLERVLGYLERGVRYLQDNFNSVFNKMYHSFQIAGAVIKAAFAFGLAKMIAGAAIVSAAAVARAGTSAVRGIGGAYGATKKGITGVKNAAKSVKGFFGEFTGGSAISNSLGIFTMLGKVMGGIASSAIILIPLLIIGAAAFGVISLALLAVGGIAAYVASKWEELSASIVKGFQDGSITLRPLVVAALVLWERLKKVGEAFIGGYTGATMMQVAIGMATSVVEGLSSGVVILAKVAAGFLTILGKLANAYDSVFGESDGKRIWNRQKELMGGGATWEDASKRAHSEFQNGFLSGPKTFGDEALGMADTLGKLANTVGAVNLKDLNPGEIEDWTKKAEQAAKDLFSGDSKSGKGPKRAAVSIGNAYFTVDLRNTDPDRMMVGLMDPIAKMARMPDSSPMDLPGF